MAREPEFKILKNAEGEYYWYLEVAGSRVVAWSGRAYTIKVQTRPGPGRGHWLLARRSISDPADVAYYACYGPRRSTVADLAWTAGSRGTSKKASSRPRVRPGWTTTRSGAGGPGMPTSPCRCSP